MRKFRYYDIILASFSAIILISNLSATKLIAFGPIILDGGVLLFPLVYLFNDVLTEVYGYKYARRVTWSGFAVMLVAVLSFTAVRYMPEAIGYNDQASFEAVLGFFPRIVLASLVAFLVGEFMNSYVLAKMKLRTNGRALGARLIGSTLIGQLFDTSIFAVIAFSGLLDTTSMINYILIGWGLKTIVEIACLPLTYRVISFLKKHERIDHYDHKTNFSPFQFKVE